MNTKAIIAMLAVVGSSTAAMADSRFRDHHTTTGVKPSVTVARPTVDTFSMQRPASRPIYTRPVVNTVSVQRPVERPIYTRPVVRPVSVPRPVTHDRGRGHGPVVHRHPIVIEQPVYQPIYRPVYQPEPVYQPVYTQPVYTQPVYTQPVYQPVYTQPVYTQPAVDNCNQSGVYVGPIGSVPDDDSYGYRSLTQPSAIQSGREIINLGAQVGPIDTLMLESNANGETSIRTIQVNFLDGGSERFDVRETLDLSNPTLTLELGHRDVANLVIYGQSQRGATYQVLAT